ncbi:MAG: hypothetical protein BGO78_17665 [Chloroflexi bacterium 44-23]|nr:MAG: hypothetical protein BGO78_17665 [Chloroflexi bacterium 44-23]
MRLGVCFYPEQCSEDRWQIEAKMMRELGLRIVRIGDFSWSKIEPSQGSYQWQWTDSLIEKLSGEGLQIVLSTPVSFPPTWLLEILMIPRSTGKNGNNAKPPGKNDFCSNHPLFKEFTLTLISEMSKRYGRNEAIIGWQINHEPYTQKQDEHVCQYCQQSFHTWLQLKYGSLDNINKAWGMNIWSQPFTSWDQINLTSHNFQFATPSYQIDLERFQSDSAIRFLNFQTDIIRSQSDNQFVTHNAKFEHFDNDLFKMGSHFDLAAWSSYPTLLAEKMTPVLYSNNDDIPEFVYDIGDPYITGFFHSWTRGIKNAPFWVMEQQCGQVSEGLTNTGIRAGALRLWTWYAVSCGAETILFSRWQPPRYSHQQLSAGILRHDGSPDLGYQEISNMLPEIPVLMTLDEDIISSKVAILTQYDDIWSLARQPHSTNYSYLNLLFNYFRVLSSTGISVDITSFDGNLSDYCLILVPGLYLSDENLVAKLEAYVAQGGSVLFGTRSGFKNQSNNLIEEPLPGLLKNLVGANVHNWQALPDQVRFKIRSDISGLGSDVGVWIEAIYPEDDEGTNTLARYIGGPLAGKAAMTVHPFGAGNVYYLGFYPSTAQLRAIIEYLLQNEGCGTILDLPEGVVVNQRGNHRVAFNFTRTEKAFVLDDKLITLPPRDFRYFLRDWN